MTRRLQLILGALVITLLAIPSQKYLCIRSLSLTLKYLVSIINQVVLYL